jgi:hypothetical protein
MSGRVLIGPRLADTIIQYSGSPWSRLLDSANEIVPPSASCRLLNNAKTAARGDGRWCCKIQDDPVLTYRGA